MKIMKVNPAKTKLSDINSTKINIVNAALDACGCTGNGYC